MLQCNDTIGLGSVPFLSLLIPNYYHIHNSNHIYNSNHDYHNHNQNLNSNHNSYHYSK